MRLRFLPLALCFLCLFSAMSTMAYSENSLALESPKLLDNKAISKKTNAKNDLKNINVDELKISSYKLPVSTIIKEKADNSGILSKLEIEENSYKNIVDENPMAAVSTKNSASITPATASLAIYFRNGMYYGFAIMVILLNLVCYFIFDEKVFMNYSLALTGITATFFFSDGLFSFFGIESLQNTQAMQSSLLLVAVGFSAWFASRYLNLSEIFPKLRWVSIALLGTAAVIVTTTWASGDILLATIANAISLGVIVAHFIAGAILFSKKNYVKFYVIASAIPVLFTIDFFVFQNFGINFLATEMIHLKAALLFEMLIISYAIVYRIQAIKEENTLRQTELRIFLKRQEVMNRQNAAKLMEDVYLENLIMHYDLDGLEIKLLQYISEGKDNKKIARKLKTTEVEIEYITKELYHKLEISEHIQEDHRMVETQPDYIYN